MIYFISLGIISLWWQVVSQMASSQQVELEAAKLLQKLIQESKDEPAKLATKLYVVCCSASYVEALEDMKNFKTRP